MNDTSSSTKTERIHFSCWISHLSFSELCEVRVSGEYNLAHFISQKYIKIHEDVAFDITKQEHEHSQCKSHLNGEILTFKY